PDILRTPVRLSGCGLGDSEQPGRAKAYPGNRIAIFANVPVVTAAPDCASAFVLRRTQTLRSSQSKVAPSGLRRRKGMSDAFQACRLVQHQMSRLSRRHRMSEAAPPARCT